MIKEMKKLFTTALMIAMFSGFLYSQKKTDTVMVKNESPLSISYSGDYMFTKPGLRLSWQNTLIKTTLKKKSSLEVTRVLYNPINVGWYHHKGYNSAWMLSSGIGYRSIRPKGFFKGAGIDLGLMRTFINGTTYEVKEDGSINTLTGGYFYGNLNLSVEAGWDFKKTGKFIPLCAFIKLNGLMQFPYNSGMLFHVMGEVGVKYPIPVKDKMKVKYKSKIQKQ